MDGKDSLVGRLIGSADKLTSKQIAQTIELLFEHGARKQASDIHIEPHDNFILVRYRIDGTLRNAHKLPLAAQKPLTTQIKSLGALDIENIHTPQHNRFGISIKDQPYAVQIATMPVHGGEKIVLHMAAQSKRPLLLAQLGYWGENLTRLQIALARTQGLILVTAPKHHGRTTTQASILGALNNPGHNIATIEESIEYHLPHVSQTAINPRHGLTMLKGLESIIHLDPNVLLVGNLPSKAVAELTIETALSGHLVIAGMHSDSAVNALLHLRALQIEPYLIASSVKLITSQRLARKLCEQCRVRTAISSRQLEQLATHFSITPSAFKTIHELEKQAAQSGIGNSHTLNTTAKTITHVWKVSRDGCEACHHTGYHERVSFTEVLALSDTMQQAIHTSDLTAAHLQAIAIKKDGFIPLELDGLIKSLRGLAAIEDVLQIARH